MRQITVNHNQWRIAYRLDSSDWRTFEAALRTHIKTTKPTQRFEFNGCWVWPH